jgi:nitroimidazol reductase NimA-like FMN-containing flavoprotein (pyridoxamine 5'-phosphate oxidase superfamily)
MPRRILAMDPLKPTPRTTIHRLPARGSYDRALVHRILDEGLYASVGFVVDGQPFVIPVVYGRLGDQIVLHGAAASRMLKHGGAGHPLCVTVTLVDGLVLARSAFHHSINYRSVVVLGVARELTDHAEKNAALTAIVNHMLAGRWDEARPPTEKELNATRVLCLPIDEASAKVRTGGPIDDEEDLVVPCWAGHLPIQLTAGAPVPDARAPVLAPVPPALLDYRRG